MQFVNEELKKSSQQRGQRSAMTKFRTKKSRSVVHFDHNHVAAVSVLFLLCIYLLASTISTTWNVPSALEYHAFARVPIPSERSLFDSAATEAAIERITHKFPVHVGQDLEEIEHPGVLFSNTVPSTYPKKISVPKFWDSTAYGLGGARVYLGNYGDRLPTPEEASSVGSWTNGLETIYISVASYRDPECGPTIESILARAKHPERIRVAVIDQRDTDQDPEFCGPETPCDQNPNQAYCKWRDQVDIYHTQAKLSVGPVFARHLGHRMYRGEYFAMQVDSHIRFIDDWDEDIISQWRSAKNEMAVLTTYLSDIIGSIDPKTNKSKHPGRPIMCESDYEGSGQLKHLRHGQQPEGPPGIKGQPTLHPFWAAGFSFARAHFVIQCPYDQYLPMVFQGEEISMGLRGFSYGYDYYAAERSVCFHMYAIKENKEKRKQVHLFWENDGAYGGAEMRSMKRLNGIIHITKDAYDTVDEKKYGLGKIRETQKFFDTFGIHTVTQTVEHHLCSFVGRPMMEVFSPHLRSNRMGINYDEITFHYVDSTKTVKPLLRQLPQKPQSKLDAKVTNKLFKADKPLLNALAAKKVKL